MTSSEYVRNMREAVYITWLETNLAYGKENGVLSPSISIYFKYSYNTGTITGQFKFESRS